MSVTKVTGKMQTGTKGGDIPSASTLVIDTDGDYFDITGTTGITAMTVDAGRRFTLQFDGAVTLTHGSSLYLPGATNFTTEANDCLSFIATAANTVRCTGYALKDGGSPVVAAGGAWTHISRVAPSSSATASFTGFNASIYDAYVFIFNLLPANDGQNCMVRCSTDGGSSYASSSEYRQISTYQLSSAATPTGSAITGSQAFFMTGAYGVGNATNEGIAGVFWIYAPDSTVYTKVSFHATSVDNSGNHLNSVGSGHLMLASDVDAVRFLFGSGNIASGEINMYGVKNS